MINARLAVLELYGYFEGGGMPVPVRPGLLISFHGALVHMQAVGTDAPFFLHDLAVGDGNPFRLISGNVGGNLFPGLAALFFYLDAVPGERNVELKEVLPYLGPAAVFQRYVNAVAIKRDKRDNLFFSIVPPLVTARTCTLANLQVGRQGPSRPGVLN